MFGETLAGFLGVGRPRDTARDGRPGRWFWLGLAGGAGGFLGFWPFGC